MTTLELSADEVLATTRAVRKRLDLSRPVPPELIRECVELALQAPFGSNVVTVDFVAVTDPAKRAAIGEFYRDGYDQFLGSPGYPRKQQFASDAARERSDRMSSSAEYLGEHMGEAPALVLACSWGPSRQAALSRMHSVMPSIWSFMLAARARGLGTAWTTLHQLHEEEIAELLDIPYQQVAQVVMTPVAYTKGTAFKRAPRPPADEVLHWDTW